MKALTSFTLAALALASVATAAIPSYAQSEFPSASAWGSVKAPGSKIALPNSPGLRGTLPQRTTSIALPSAYQELYQLRRPGGSVATPRMPVKGICYSDAQSSSAAAGECQTLLQCTSGPPICRYDRNRQEYRCTC